MTKKALTLTSFLIVFMLAFQVFSVMADTATFQPSSKDSQLLSGYPDTNYGGELWLAVCNLPKRRSVVQFDISSIPPGSIVHSATLRLYYGFWATNNPAGRTFWAYRVTHSWLEDGVTWNTYDGVNNWSSPGGEYTVSGGDSQTVPPDAHVWMTWNVTDIAKAWIENGSPNYGFIIRDGDETGAMNNHAYFLPKEYSNPDLHPQLIIEYTPKEPVGGEIAPTNLLLPLTITSIIVVILFNKKLSTWIKQS